ncbi:Putative Tyrosine--tRNA ligase gene leader peptide [Deinococcus deserti]|uniref:Putative Tyrosine--tRNA ligase gene leader peptide n=1 Tax=Deinococcus deserti (strain DSM 17065 / CIP 109153 / LMG 22923 / VCD115) TaxID=546414 RepID=X5HLA0_DEIDV|nr:putative Tyrosine--tRNA ligase gene leader peptide [Deinococcus deserti VCD115]
MRRLTRRAYTPRR